MTGKKRALNIGIDLGGSHIGLAVLDSQTGSVLADKSSPIEAQQPPRDVVNGMERLARQVIDETAIILKEIDSIGIGVPGRVDMANGIVRFLPNLANGWKDFPLSQAIEQKLGKPAYLINDVRALTLAEWTFGAGRGATNLACIAIGTGVGGGFIIDAKLHLALDGMAGEVGHHIVAIDGPICECGNRGCLETFISGPAITARGIQAVAQGTPSLISDLAGNDPARITPMLIHQAAKAGDRVAIEIFEQAGIYLGILITNLVTSIGVTTVVISGGVAQAGDFLLEPARRTVKERLRIVPFEQVELVPAQLSPRGGMIGAALWASLSQKPIK